MCELAQAYGLVENKGINWIFIQKCKEGYLITAHFWGVEVWKKGECKGSAYFDRKNSDTAFSGL